MLYDVYEKTHDKWLLDRECIWESRCFEDGIDLQYEKWMWIAIVYEIEY